MGWEEEKAGSGMKVRDVEDNKNEVLSDKGKGGLKWGWDKEGKKKRSKIG